MHVAVSSKYGEMANDNIGNVASRTQTIHLRVYVHCEGCKKKVKKILGKIEGVYTVEIDASVGKVTVTGTVDAATLVKRLEKAHKVAQLWPCVESPPSPPQVASKGKEEEKDTTAKESVVKHEKQQQKQDEEAKRTDAAPQHEKYESGEKKVVANAPNNNNNSNDSSSSNKTSSVAPTVVAAASDKKKPDQIEGSSEEQKSKKKNKNKNPNNGGGEGNEKKGEKSAEDGEGNVGKMDGKSYNADGKEDNAGNRASPRPEMGAAGQSGCKKEIVDVVENHGNNADGKEKKMTRVVVDDDDDGVHKSQANRHMAPPPMVLVETSPAYSMAEMGSSAEAYGTHIFSDENANNCSLM